MKKIILAILAIGLSSSVLAGRQSSNLKGKTICLASSGYISSIFDNAISIDNSIFENFLQERFKTRFTLYRIPFEEYPKCSYESLRLYFNIVSTPPLPAGWFAHHLELVLTDFSKPDVLRIGYIDVYTNYTYGVINKDNSQLTDAMQRKASDFLDEFALDYIRANK